jgi:hypothetical protein
MGTSDIWIYHDTLRTDVGNGADIVGYDVEATDGSIGKVDKRSTEAGPNYLVVDTGFWIFGHKRLIPRRRTPRRPERAEGLRLHDEGGDQERAGLR